MNASDRSAPPRAPARGFRLKPNFPAIVVDITGDEAADVEAFKKQRMDVLTALFKLNRPADQGGSQ